MWVATSGYHIMWSSLGEMMLTTLTTEDKRGRLFESRRLHVRMFDISATRVVVEEKKGPRRAGGSATRGGGLVGWIWIMDLQATATATVTATVL